MDIQRASGAHSSYIDVVDRVLDKGIVIDAWMRVSVGGIDLITVEAHLIVASIDTYLEHCASWDEARGIERISLCARAD